MFKHSVLLYGKDKTTVSVLVGYKIARAKNKHKKYEMEGVCYRTLNGDYSSRQ